jgi:hypothetical protein
MREMTVEHVVGAKIKGFKETKWKEGDVVRNITMQIDFGGGKSIIIDHDDPLLEKIAIGDEIDFTYVNKKETPNSSASGSVHDTWVIYNFAEVYAVRPGKINEFVASLPNSTGKRTVVSREQQVTNSSKPAQNNTDTGSVGKA